MAENPSTTKTIRLGPASAYAIAVEHGYQGTEAEWIEHLMQTTQNAQDAASSAQDAADSASAAAGSAQDASDAKDLAITAIGEAKDAALGDISDAKTAAVSDVGDAKTAALSDLSDSRDAIIAEGGIQKQAVSDQGTLEVQAVSGEGTTQVAAVQGEGADQIAAVQAQGVTSVAAVDAQEDLSVAAVSAQEDLSVAAVEAKGQEVLESIPQDYTELTAEVSDLKSSLYSGPSISWSKGTMYANGGLNSSGNGALSSAIAITDHSKKLLCMAGSSAGIGFWNGSTYIGKIGANGSINSTGGDWKTFTGTFDISSYIPQNATNFKVSLVSEDGTTVTSDNVTAWANSKFYIADRIGEIEADISSCNNDIDNIAKKLGEVDLTDVSAGYLNTDGTVHAATDSLEVYTNQYIPVIPYETVTVNITLSTGKNQWARWCFYDAEKNVIGSGTQAQTWTQSLTIQITIPDNAAYIRISYRSYSIVTSFVLRENNAVTVSLVSYTSAVSNRIIQHNQNCIYVAHQGYDPASTGTNSGYNKLNGYYAAAEHGFDAGEVDVRFSSDGIPVCCHDSTFTDATSGDTITIASSTYAQLVEHDYYGGTIAKFEDVLKACKDSGIMLFIDQVNLAASDSDKLNAVFNLVKTYGMAERVWWLFTYNTRTFFDAVDAVFKNTNYEILVDTSADDAVSNCITFANAEITDNNKIVVGVNYGVVSASDVKTYAAQLDPRCKMAVWTIPQSTSTCLQYMPYVGAITTNRTSYNDVYNNGLS